MTGFFNSFAPAASARHGGRAGAQSDPSRALGRAAAGGGGRRSDPGAERVRPGFSKPDRHGRGFRQGGQGARRPAEARLRLRRGRHAHAAPPGRQRKAAPVPPRTRIAASSTASASTTAAIARVRERLVAARGAWRRGRRQRRRQQGIRPTAPPITSPASRISPISPAISPSTSPRPTRRACATCSRPARSTTSWRGDRRARRGGAATAAPPGAAEDRAGPALADLDDVVAVARGAWRGRHDRLQHHHCRARTPFAIRCRARPAGFPARRCSRCRRTCSPRLSCASRGSFR